MHDDPTPQSDRDCEYGDEANYAFDGFLIHGRFPSIQSMILSRAAADGIRPRSILEISG